MFKDKDAWIRIKSSVRQSLNTTDPEQPAVLLFFGRNETLLESISLSVAERLVRLL